MRTFFLLFLGSLFSIGISSFVQAPSAPNQLLFKDAIAQNKIKCVLSANGGHQDKSVKAKLTNLGNSSIEIKMPYGTVFQPNDNGDQDLLMVQDELIVLQPKQSKEFLLDAYCIESNDSSPMANEKMTFRTLSAADPLAKLCARMSSKKFAPSDIQSAVWAVSDNGPIEYLSNANPNTNNLRETVCSLTGRENTWYNADANRRITPDRRIETSSTFVSGKISVTLSARANIQTKVVDKDGATKLSMGTKVFDRAGTWGYAFNLKVTGWEKSDYKAIILQDGKEIKSYPFSV
jgi:hypothetical protein